VEGEHNKRSFFTVARGFGRAKAFKQPKGGVSWSKRRGTTRRTTLKREARKYRGGVVIGKGSPGVWERALAFQRGFHIRNPEERDLPRKGRLPWERERSKQGRKACWPEGLTSIRGLQGRDPVFRREKAPEKKVTSNL